jgi:hypothetical protein
MRVRQAFLCQFTRPVQRIYVRDNHERMLRHAGQRVLSVRPRASDPLKFRNLLHRKVGGLKRA